VRAVFTIKGLWFRLLLLVLSLGSVQAQQIALPSTSTPLTSEAGQRLLAESVDKADFLALAVHYQTQNNASYCGPSCAVMVLNALAVPAPDSAAHPPYKYFDQENFFTAETEKVLPRETLLKQGVTLEQLAGMLRGHGLQVKAVHAEPGGLEAFRQTARAAVGSGRQFVLVNFIRQPLQQEGGGHFSPLAAYHAETDQFLVMDVARYKYPPFWVPAADLFGAMSTLDKTAQANRGYLVVER